MTSLPQSEGPMVSKISLRCDVCREALKRERRGVVARSTLWPRRRPPGCTCKRVYAAGQGPATAPDMPVGEAPPPPVDPPAAPPV